MHRVVAGVVVVAVVAFTASGRPVLAQSHAPAEEKAHAPAAHKEPVASEYSKPAHAETKTESPQRPPPATVPEPRAQAPAVRGSQAKKASPAPRAVRASPIPRY